MSNLSYAVVRKSVIHIVVVRKSWIEALTNATPVQYVPHHNLYSTETNRNSTSTLKQPFEEGMTRQSVHTQPHSPKMSSHSMSETHTLTHIMRHNKDLVPLLQMYFCFYLRWVQLINKVPTLCFSLSFLFWFGQKMNLFLPHCSHLLFLSCLVALIRGKYFCSQSLSSTVFVREEILYTRQGVVKWHCTAFNWIFDKSPWQYITKMTVFLLPLVGGVFCFRPVSQSATLEFFFHNRQRVKYL